MIYFESDEFDAVKFSESYTVKYWECGPDNYHSQGTTTAYAKSKDAYNLIEAEFGKRFKDREIITIRYQ